MKTFFKGKKVLPTLFWFLTWEFGTCTGFTRLQIYFLFDPQSLLPYFRISRMFFTVWAYYVVQQHSVADENFFLPVKM